MKKSVHYPSVQGDGTKYDQISNDFLSLGTNDIFMRESENISDNVTDEVPEIVIDLKHNDNFLTDSIKTVADQKTKGKIQMEPILCKHGEIGGLCKNCRLSPDRNILCEHGR